MSEPALCLGVVVCYFGGLLCSAAVCEAAEYDLGPLILWWPLILLLGASAAPLILTARLGKRLGRAVRTRWEAPLPEPHMSKETN